MIRNEGWTVPLGNSGYATPPTCASCNGPRKTQVVLQTSKRSGNVTTILRMKMPYCDACAARVSGAGIRMMVLFCVVTTVAIGLPGAAGVVDLGAAPLLVAAGGGGVAMLLTVAAALVMLPKKPAGSATARGEAATVSRYDDAGNIDIFCTNGEWAQRLATANRTQATPTTRYRLIEILATVWGTVLAASMVGLVGYAAEHPPAPASAVPTTSASASASSSAASATSASPSSSASAALAKAGQTPPKAAAPKPAVPSKPTPAGSAAPKRK